MAQDLRTESKMKMETNEILKSFYIHIFFKATTFISIERSFNFAN